MDCMNGSSRGFKTDYLARLVQHCEAHGLLPGAFHELAAALNTRSNEIKKGLSQENITRLYYDGSMRAERRLRSFVNWNTERPPLMWNPDDAPPMTIFA
ncbi:hypothetical protein K439DRAFT_775088 [Ramaria rubella]|nr:hypothetical protein K439DRAFT_775088 [Ramaria rubella]